MSTTLRSLTVGVVANAAPFQKGMGSVVSSLRGSITSVLGIVGGLALLQQALEEDAIATSAVSNLESVLNSTGHAAGFTSRQLQQMATDLERVTTFGDDTTIQAQAVMATFKNIKGDIFADAIASAQDMATVLGADLQGTVMQLAKALNEPDKGLKKLARSGVSFSKEQETLIKSLVKMGNVAGAQRIILQELDSEFGGAATAKAKTLAGQIDQLKNSFGNLLEEGIALATPVLQEFVNGLKFVVSAIAQLRLPTFTGNVLRLATSFGAAVLVLPKVISLMRGVASVLSLIASRQAIVQALSGPKGWLQLAGGIVIATGTLVALHDMMEGTSEAATTQASAVRISTQAIADHAEATEAQIKAEEKLIESLKEEIAAFGLTGAALEIHKAKLKGASAEVIAEAKKLQSVLAGKEQAVEAAKAYDELIAKGKELTDSLKSPAEQQQALLDQYREMAMQGIITWETYAKAVQKAQDEVKNLNGAQSQAIKSPQALEKGSSGAFQAIAEQRGMDAMRKLQEQQLTEARKQTALQEKIAAQGQQLDRNEPVTVNF